MRRRELLHTFNQSMIDTRRNRLKRMSLLIIPVAVLIATGCVSIPKEAPGELYIGMMPDTTSVYMKLNVARNIELAATILKPIQEGQLEETTDGNLLDEQLLERTDAIYGGFSTSPDGASGFSIAAVGRFPTGIISCNLNQSDDLEHRRKPNELWEATDGSFKIAFPAPYILCLSTLDIEDMITRFKERQRHPLPEEVRREFDISDLVVYMPAPGKSTVFDTGTGPSIGSLPIEGLWLTMYSTMEGYRTSIVFNVTPKRANQVAMLARILVIGILRSANIEAVSQLNEGVEVTAFQDTVRVTGLVLSTADIATLLESDLLQSKKQ